jgi:hypothetical protein
MLRFSSSSTKPRRRRPSMSAAFWFRKEPPPNSLINRRCSDLVNSSHRHRGHLDVPCNSRATPYIRNATTMIAYAAKACRTAAESNCSAAGVSRENLMSPRRVKVRRATGSQNSVETPPFNIAKVRCSSTSKSVHAIPSIPTPRLATNFPMHDRTRKVKDLLKLSTGPRNESR